jgi:hypothetical protein
VEGGERLFAALLARLERDERYRRMRVRQFGLVARPRRFPSLATRLRLLRRAVGDCPHAVDAPCRRDRGVRALGAELGAHREGEP